jgi:hypothetical protein
VSLEVQTLRIIGDYWVRGEAPIRQTSHGTRAQLVCTGNAQKQKGTDKNGCPTNLESLRTKRDRQECLSYPISNHQEQKGADKNGCPTQSRIIKNKKGQTRMSVLPISNHIGKPDLVFSGWVCSLLLRLLC